MYRYIGIHLAAGTEATTVNTWGLMATHKLFLQTESEKQQDAFTSISSTFLYCICSTRRTMLFMGWKTDEKKKREKYNKLFSACYLSPLNKTKFRVKH